MLKTADTKSKFWPLFFLICFVEGVIALVNLILIPAEGGWLFGYSSTRLIFLGILLTVLLLLAGLFFLSWRNQAWRDSWLETAHHKKFYSLLNVLAVAGAFLAGLVLFLLRYANPSLLLPLYYRARPLLIFFGFFCAQMAFWLMVLRCGIRKEALSFKKDIAKTAIIPFVILLVVWGFVAVTGLGLDPDPGYWAEPGVPLLGWQVGLSVLGGWFILLIGLNDWSKGHPHLFDFILAVTLWGIAVGIWMSVPLDVLKNSFYAPIWPPSNQPFPYSDAGMYDYSSRSLLLGNGFARTIPPRPLFIVFLAGLHWIFGTGYEKVVLGQTLVLALFPVVLYFLGKKLHTRGAGFAVGLMAIFRELTTLMVSSQTRVSNTKMLLSDLPSTLALCGYLLYAVHWFSKKDRTRFDTFLAGGLFGLLLLLRTQLIFLLFGLAVVAFLSFRVSWKRLLGNVVLFFIGVALSVAPWMVRNWWVTGSASLDDPNQVKLVASLYSAGSLDYMRTGFSQVSTGEATKAIFLATLNNPGYVAGFIANHFLASEIDTLLVLPMIEEYNGLSAPINTYWLTWDGRLIWYNVLLLVGYLLLIAIGLGASWRCLRWIGCLPLLFNLSYALSDGAARISGWRYILPVDWVGYLYFGIGVFVIVRKLVMMFGDHPHKNPHINSPDTVFSTSISTRPATWKFMVSTALFLIVGGLPSILENIIPSYFRITEPTALIQKLVASPAVASSGVDVTQLQIFLEQPRGVITTGRLLYPRFLMTNQELRSTNPWPAYASRDFNRMGFVLLKPGGALQVVLPVKNIPEPFLNDSDVILVGCEDGNYFKARLILFLANDIYYQTGQPFEGCEGH